MSFTLISGKEPVFGNHDVVMQLTVEVAESRKK